MKLHELLQKVENADHGSPELDNDFARAFESIQANVTTSFDAVVSLIEQELPNWWWSCGYFKIANGESVSISDSGEVPAGIRAVVGVDVGPEAMHLLNHPELGQEFDEGFFCIRRTGTFQVALLVAFLKGKIALAQFEQDAVEQVKQ